MRLRTCLLSLALGAVLGAAPETVVPRSGLPNFARSLAAGELVRLVAFGGTATASPGVPAGQDLPDQLSRAFRGSFPKGKLRVMKQGMVQTGAWLGAFRTDTEAIRHYVPLGLVVVEFAADDASEPPERILAAVEGIVRKIRRAAPTADILFLHGAREDWQAEYQAGRVPPAVAVCERVADHYGIPSVNAGAHLARKQPPEGEKWWADGQPTAALLARCAEPVAEYAAQLAAAPTADTATKHQLPTPPRHRVRSNRPGWSATSGPRWTRAGWAGSRARSSSSSMWSTAPAAAPR